MSLPIIVLAYFPYTPTYLQLYLNGLVSFSICNVGILSALILPTMKLPLTTKRPHPLMCFEDVGNWHFVSQQERLRCSRVCKVVYTLPLN